MTELLRKEVKKQNETTGYNDQIKQIYTDSDGKVNRVILNDGNNYYLKDFIDLFKSKLKTIVAGEVITWDDEWRYQRQIDPKTMEQYLDVVEAEGLVSQSKFQLSSRAKISLGVIIILFFVAIIGLVMLKNAGMI